MRKQYIHEIAEKYTEMYNMLLTYAVCKLKNEDLAEEAVQETFRIACQKADAFYDSKNRSGWLVNTLKNVISNTQRKQCRAQTYAADCMASPEDFLQTTDNIDLDVLYRDIALSDEYILIKEFVLEQKSIRELAEERNISVAACKKRVQRAKQALRKYLKSIGVC